MKPILLALAAACLLFAAALAIFVLLRPAARRDDGASPHGSRGAELPAATPIPRGANAEDAGAQVEAQGAATGQAASARTQPRVQPGDATRGEEAKGLAKGSLSIPRGDAGVVFELSDTAGKPFASAAVTLLRGRAAQTVICDGLGAAAFGDIEAGTYTFTVEGDGIPELVSARELSLAPGEEKRVPLKIDTYALSISGRVLDRNGAPVPGITVGARRQLFQPIEGDLLRSDQETLESRSGPGGLYEIRGLDAADYVVRTEATDSYPSVKKVYRAGVRSADIILEEARLLTMHGVVAARDGQGLEGVRVLPLGQTTRQTETDPDGRYQIDIEITDGQSVQVITGNKDGYREARVNVRMDEAREEDGLELNMVLDSLGARAAVSGTITGEDRNPVSGETVYLHSSSMNARYQAVSDARGRFTLAGVQVGGDYRLWVYPRQGFKDFLKTPVEVPESGAELEIVLEPIESGNLHGVMVDARGSPVPGFTFWLRSLKALGNSAAVTGDGSGRFEATGVPEGELVFETRSLPRLTVLGIQFSPSSEAELKLVLDWGANSFSGTVAGEGGAPVSGANVSLYWSQRLDGAQGSSFRSSVTDASGRFSFSELGSGEHKITVSSAEYAPGQAVYEVGSGAPEPTIRLKPKAARQQR